MECQRCKYRKPLITAFILWCKMTVLIPNSILSILLEGRVGYILGNIDLKISNTQHRLKKTIAYKKKACRRVSYPIEGRKELRTCSEMLQLVLQNHKDIFVRRGKKNLSVLVRARTPFASRTMIFFYF